MQAIHIYIEIQVNCSISDHYFINIFSLLPPPHPYPQLYSLTYPME